MAQQLVRPVSQYYRPELMSAGCVAAVANNFLLCWLAGARSSRRRSTAATSSSLRARRQQLRQRD
jgi:hypothetical protein